jgi:monoterpene epsilon-lactone hydrolase
MPGKNTYTAILLAGLTATSLVALAAPEITADLSPQARQYLERAKSGDMAAMDMSDPARMAKLRKALGAMFLKSALKIDPDLYLTEQEMNDVSGYWVNSSKPEKTGRVILYLHGGGHILGSAQTNLGSAIRVHKASGIPVLSVEYRLAPEHPFPADLNDAVAAYRWLLDQGYEGGEIGVYGDSAGGGLSLGLGLVAREQHLPMPAAIAVLSPLLDVNRVGDTRVTLANIDPVIRSAIGGRYGMYVGDADPRNPLLSPVYADYSDFPPLLIQVGTRERLLSDSIRLARQARNHGVDVELDVWDGMWHVWQDTPGVPEAEQACRELAGFFTRNLK